MIMNFDHEGTCVVCQGGPKALGPCDICISCDASLGEKARNWWKEKRSKT